MSKKQQTDPIETTVVEVPMTIENKNVSLSFFKGHPFATVNNIGHEVATFEEADHLVVSVRGIKMVEWKTTYRYTEIVAGLKAAKHLSFKSELPEPGLREYRGINNSFVTGFQGAGAVHLNYRGTRRADIFGLPKSADGWFESFGLPWAKLVMRNGVLLAEPLSDIWKDGQISTPAPDLARLYDTMDELLQGVTYVLALTDKANGFGVGGRHENFLRVLLEEITLGTDAMNEPDPEVAKEKWAAYKEVTVEHFANGSQSRAASAIYRQEHNIVATTGNLPLDDGERPAMVAEDGVEYSLNIWSGVSAGHPKATVVEVIKGSQPVQVKYTYANGQSTVKTVYPTDRFSVANHNGLKALLQEVVS